MNKYNNDLLPGAVLRQTADRFRELRKQRGYTQPQLAERAGVSLGSLKRFEQTGQVAFASLLRLAHVLDVLTAYQSAPPATVRSNEGLSALFDRIEQQYD